jgi:hypothetical protein
MAYSDTSLAWFVTRATLDGLLSGYSLTGHNHDAAYLARADVNDSLGAVSVDLVPSVTDVFELGTTTKRWENVYAYNSFIGYGLTLTGPATVATVTIDNGKLGALTFSEPNDYEQTITGSGSIILKAESGDIYMHPSGNVLIGTGWTTDSALTNERGYSGRGMKLTGNLEVGGTVKNGSGVYYTLKSDVAPIFVFGAGGGNATDTAAFTTSTYYGSFFNKGTDTIVVTSLNCVMGHGIGTDTLEIQVSWDDSLGGTGAVNLNTAALPINSIGPGTEDTSFDNAKIPPNVWVWAKTTVVVAGRKPTYLATTLSGYRIKP